MLNEKITTVEKEKNIKKEKIAEKRQYKVETDSEEEDKESDAQEEEREGTSEEKSKTIVYKNFGKDNFISCC